MQHNVEAQRTNATIPPFWPAFEFCAKLLPDALENKNANRVRERKKKR
jgi:hypothetical protein